MDDREDRIRARAYAIWEEEGRPEGRQEEHWRQAEASMADPAMTTSRQATSAGQQGDTGPSERANAATRGGPQRGAMRAGTAQAQAADVAT